MITTDLSTFLLVYLSLVFAGAVFVWLRNRTAISIAGAIIAGVALFGSLIVLSRLGRPVVLPDELLNGLSARKNPTLLAIATAVSAALPSLGLLWVVGRKCETTQRTGSRMSWLGLAVLLAGLIGTVGGFGLFLFEETNDFQIPFIYVHDPRYVVEEIATFEVAPIRLAIDEERDLAFVSYYTDDGQGLFDGGVHQVSTVLVDGKPNRPSLAVSSPILYRPFGLAVRDGDLYLSRCGIFTSASNGKFTHPSLAAVTRVSDLDGNGVYEYFHDVVTDLPGARSPDVQHQNNEIAFDDEGNLFIAIGSNDDRSLDDHPWGGTLLKASPDFQNVEVFARGLRNPFGIAVARDEQGEVVYITDNDVRSNRGDEVNVARKGSHFGHPYVAGMDKAGKDNGFVDPIWMGTPNGNLNGIVHLGEQFDDLAGSLLVLDRATEARITMIRPAKDGQEQKVRVFMNIPSPVDAVATSKGEIYIVCRDYNKLFRVRKK